jgi:hypothetical protein
VRALTIRNVPPSVAEALDRERKRRGVSLNETVLALLRQGLGVGAPRSNGLAAMAGGWTEKEAREFETSIDTFEWVDEDLWR